MWEGALERMSALVKYKKYWDKKTAEEDIAKEKTRIKAIREAKCLKDILVKEFSVKKVVLFGSVLEAGGFKEGSDIDIAVDGLPKKLYFRALARLMMESAFEVDLKPIEDVSELLRERIKKGKVIYEKTENSRSNLRD